MKIANPIYDVVFRYLMKDKRVASLIISSIIEREIVSLDFGFTELDRKLPDGGITVLRLDFSAHIKEKDGSQKRVLIELQKAKFSTDIMRFRRYLGKQYLSDSNIYEDDQSHERKAMPIISIYILGHKLKSIDEPVVHVKRSYLDHATKKNIRNQDDFIESLTHDSYIIQVPNLPQRHGTKLEAILSVFDQNAITAQSKHFLNFVETTYPEEYKIIVRQLQKAAASEEVCEEMNLEDEFMEELANQERAINYERAAKERALEAKERERAAKEKALEAKEKAIAETEQQKDEIRKLKALLNKSGIKY